MCGKLRGSEWEESGAVFANTFGVPWEPTSTTARFNLLVRRAGLPRLFDGPHGLRHTHATHLLADGWDIGVVAARLGHTPATLAKHYAHVIRGRSKAAGSYLSEVLGLVERTPKLRVVDNVLTPADRRAVEQGGSGDYGLQMPQAL